MLHIIITIVLMQKIKNMGTFDRSLMTVPSVDEIIFINFNSEELAVVVETVETATRLFAFIFSFSYRYQVSFILTSNKILSTEDYAEY